MFSVHEVSALSGISVRTLHYYDEIGLLVPAKITEAGYRQYDEENLERLQQILLFRELEFPLKEIKEIMASPCFAKKRAIEDQIRLLNAKKEHFEELIALAENIRKEGKVMSFEAFDDQKSKRYKEEARKRWGATEAYHEFEKKGLSQAQENAAGEGLMCIFEAFGAIKDRQADSPEAQALVEKLRGYISEHFYTCTKTILSGLGQMYAAGGEMTENIDRAGGEGTARFAADAIAIYCQ